MTYMSLGVHLMHALLSCMFCKDEEWWTSFWVEKSVILWFKRKYLRSKGFKRVY